MANFGPAIAFTLQEEGGYSDDQTRAPLPPTGEVVNRGLTLIFLRSIGYLGNPAATGPATPAEIETIKAITVPTAQSLYLEYFWKPYRCGEIDDQACAGKYFDVCVNTGPREGCLILQRAINSAVGVQVISVDGVIGPMTIAAANNCVADKLIGWIREEGAAFYNQAQPASRRAGWLARLAKG